MKYLKILIVLLAASSFTRAQNVIKWPGGKKAAIALTYDDALASQLDIAIPQLNSAGLKGTFFLTGNLGQSAIPRWQQASKTGHELGNHTVYHPCLSAAFPAD